jgi:hypothetical protein
MSDKKDEGLPLLLDASAASANPKRPAFLAKPAGAPVYHGFPLVPETEIDGWCYGAITAYQSANGRRAGDGYVQAPDGSRAGLVWEVGQREMSEIMPPEPARWGVYAVWFPKPVRNVTDLRDCFAHVLPQLRARYEQLRSQQTV